MGLSRSVVLVLVLDERLEVRRAALVVLVVRLVRPVDPLRAELVGVARELARQDEADRHLHLALRERRRPAVADEAARLLHDAVEAVVRKLVHDVHGLRRNRDVPALDLAEHAVEVIVEPLFAPWLPDCRPSRGRPRRSERLLGRGVGPGRGRGRGWAPRRCLGEAAHQARHPDLAFRHGLLQPRRVAAGTSRRSREISE